MKFLVDMPISPDAARWLIEKGHDATHASDVGLDRAPDLEVLEAARIQDRNVVTADLDYPPRSDHPRRSSRFDSISSRELD